jgi:hypothetical protein
MCVALTVEMNLCGGVEDEEETRGKKRFGVSVNRCSPTILPDN